MPLPTCREIRNQLLALVGVAVVTIVATTVFVARPVGADERAERGAAPATWSRVNWDDVNLDGAVTSPENEVTTARSKMLQDFEAR